MRSLLLSAAMTLSLCPAVAISAPADAPAPPLEVPGQFRIPTPAGCRPWKAWQTGMYMSFPADASADADQSAILLVRRDPADGNTAARAEFVCTGHAEALEGARSGRDIKDDCPSIDGPIPDRVSFTVSCTGQSGQPFVARVAIFFGKQADYRLIVMARTVQRAAEMAKAMDGLVELAPAPAGTLVVPGWFQVPAPDGFAWRLYRSQDVAGIPVRTYRAKPINGHGEDDEVLLVARRPAPRTEADRAGHANDFFNGTMEVLKKLHCTDLHGEPPAADPADPERRPFRISARTPEGKTLVVHGGVRVMPKGYYAFQVIANSEERAAQLEAAVVPQLTEPPGEAADEPRRAATTRPRGGGSEKAWNVAGAKTQLVGGTGGRPFAVVEGDGPVLGFRYESGTWGGKPVLRRLLPVYAATNAPAGKGEVMGRAGYVVGGLIVDGDKNVNAVKVIFVRREGGTAADAYTTDWIGTPRAANEPTQLAGNGETVTGVYGRAGMNLDAVGLVVKGEVDRAR